MEITTKYDIGQKVWTINDKRAVCFEIRGINFRREIDEAYKTSQPVTVIEYKGTFVDWTLEDDLYPTKEELLNSL